MVSSLRQKVISRSILPSSFLLHSLAFASDGHFYWGAQYGLSFVRAGTNPVIIVYDENTVTDSYALNHNTTATGVLGLQVGYELSGCNTKPAIAFGLGIYDTAPSPYKFNGALSETFAGAAGQTLYDYQYQVNSTRLMAETKLTWTLPNQLAPFAEIGIGSAWNQMTQYSETPTTSNGYVALPGFQSHTNVNFAYQLGAGIGYSFNLNQENTNFKHERLTLGYRYVNLGNANFGTRGSDYPYAFTPGKLTTNDVYLGLIHLF